MLFPCGYSFVLARTRSPRNLLQNGGVVVLHIELQLRYNRQGRYLSALSPNSLWKGVSIKGYVPESLGRCPLSFLRFAMRTQVSSLRTMMPSRTKGSLLVPVPFQPLTATRSARSLSELTAIGVTTSKFCAIEQTSSRVIEDPSGTLDAEGTHETEGTKGIMKTKRTITWTALLSV